MPSLDSGRPFDRISIHAPRMGSDKLAKDANDSAEISIHAPRMGSDDTAFRMPFHMSEFQSTLPGWGATGRNVFDFP